MSVLDKEKPPVIDDTIPLTCVITGTETVQSHTEFILRIQRGPLKENTWEIRRRYNDFVVLHETLKVAGVELPLPPKRLLGNMEREFIAERQHGLETLMTTILKHPMLAASDVVKKFLDTINYNTNHTELALQFVSMFLRSDPSWEVVEPLREMGWRIRKSFFLIKPKDQPKQRMLLSWVEYGPDRLLSSKDQASVMKLLPNIQHPSIYPIAHALANENGALTIKGFHKDGSLRDYICKTKTMKTPFLKKYANPKSPICLPIPELRQYGRQILEVLKFLNDKGLAFHHLHSGNVLIEKEVCKLTDIENYLLGIPPFYKPFYSQFRKVHSSESIDVYSFGQLLYEMVYGRPLNQATIDFLPPQSPAEIRSVLESILSSEACKNGLPTLEGLLSHPFFADETVTTVGIKPQLKIPSKLKETFRQYKEALERKLKEEQKVIGQVRRLSKAKVHHNSESERRRRKLEARKKSQKKLELVEENPDQSKASTPTTPTPTATSSEATTPVTSIPPPPPPPPSMAPPIPPAPPVSPPPQASGAGRGALLGSIQGFKKGGLRKSVTVDKSGPRV
uniref:PX domain-containing protein kinase-like protein n=1 Tax=Phallusia mammillata TaxID=59560 RepID=A0A6F9DQL9_9ASCI|nr:PX domain-containing protein kinase-like protein [Phallusia mammillata]